MKLIINNGYSIKGAIYLCNWEGKLVPLPLNPLTNHSRKLGFDHYAYKEEDIEPLIGQVRYRYIKSETGAKIASKIGFSLYEGVGCWWLVTNLSNNRLKKLGLITSPNH